MKPEERIIVALDVDSVQKAIYLAEELKPHVGAFKIGLEFITSMMASLVTENKLMFQENELDRIHRLFDFLAGKIFWDGKFDDIPNTVAGASKAVAKMRVKMFNVHASAGIEAIKQAVAHKGQSLVLGVTVLTSIGGDECKSIFGEEPGPKVIQFAKMLVAAGADGIICSPQELNILSNYPELSGLQKVTPGIRPKWAVAGDQKRIMTPSMAVAAGADRLVIGRPITDPPADIKTPTEAVERIIAEIDNAVRHGIVVS